MSKAENRDCEDAGIDNPGAPANEHGGQPGSEKEIDESELGFSVMPRFFTWEQVGPPIPCGPPALMDYAAKAHARCSSTCVYCGFGVHSVGYSETAFDIWRQMDLEHIVPRSLAGEEALATRLSDVLPAMPDALQVVLCQRIRDMNEVTACRFCNSVLQEDIGDWARAQFNAVMTAIDPAATLQEANGLVTDLASVIWEAWKFKAVSLWQRLIDIRRRFQAGPGVHMCVPLSEHRAMPTPKFLARRFQHLLWEVRKAPWPSVAN